MKYRNLNAPALTFLAAIAVLATPIAVKASSVSGEIGEEEEYRPQHHTVGRYEIIPRASRKDLVEEKYDEAVRKLLPNGMQTAFSCFQGSGGSKKRAGIFLGDYGGGDIYAGRDSHDTRHMRAALRKLNSYNLYALVDGPGRDYKLVPLKYKVGSRQNFPQGDYQSTEPTPAGDVTFSWNKERQDSDGFTRSDLSLRTADGTVMECSISGVFDAGR